MSASMFAIAQQVAIVFASGLEDGSTSALANAVVFWQLPFGIFSVSVVTAHFPRMSRYAAAGDTMALAGTFAGGLMMIVDLLLPPALFYLFFGEAVIRVALERMTFSAAGTALAGSVLAGYAVGLVGVGVFNFAQRYFFATRDYRSPFLAALMVAAIDIPPVTVAERDLAPGHGTRGRQLHRVFRGRRRPGGRGVAPPAASES